MKSRIERIARFLKLLSPVRGWEIVRSTFGRTRRYGWRSGWNCFRTPLMNAWVMALNHYRIPKVECPCCGWRGYSFRYVDIGQWVLPQIECPVCGNRDRHRLLRLVMDHPSVSALFCGARVMHCAPELAVRTWMDRLGARFVVSSDLDPFLYASAPPPKVGADLTALPFKTDSFDAAVCVHVLEHIPDDLGALRETLRVLRPGGACLFMVPFGPISATFEYGKPNPELFGHVRDYSENDFALKLEGFDVQAFRADPFLEEADRTGYQIPPDQTVFVCRKPVLLSGSVAGK